MILIHPKKLILIPVIIFELIGCASIGPNTTYYMGVRTFKYNPAYASYMVEIKWYRNRWRIWKSSEYISWALLHKPICKGFFSDIIFK